MQYSVEADYQVPQTVLLDTTSFEIICAVARRSLVHRFRGVSLDSIRDAVQEAVCRLYEHRPMRSEINPRTIYSWIYTTASRELAHALKRLVRVRETVEAHDQEGTSLTSSQTGLRYGDVGAEPAEELNDLLTYNALLSYLSNNLAEAVQLHFEGYTADEIAIQLGCSRAAAYKRVQRGCVEMRELWQQEEWRVATLSQ
ncbi:MAG: hypothetical protein JST22_06055 [Bacteroidetes bacterium]|nr:hypothetical protein [Bacteroidota bacterium]